MTKAEIIEAWAPPGGRWSPWAKPVLFACMDEVLPSGPLLPILLEPGIVPPPGDTALVLDLPEAEAISVAVGLLGEGYWPVPLYNSMPGPTLPPTLYGSSAAGPISVVNVAPIIAAL